MVKITFMKRYLPLISKISPLLIFLLMEYLVQDLSRISYLISISLVLVIFSVWGVKTRKDTDIKWYIFLIFPVLLELSFTTYLVMEPISPTPHYLILVNSVILYFYFRTLRSFFSGIDKGVSLNNITIFGNFILVFFMASSVYGLQSFLRFPVFVLMAFFSVFLALVVYSVMYVNKVDNRVSIFYVLIVCLIMIELAWSVYFLPVSYKVSGMVLAVCYYMVMGLSRHHLAETLNSKTVKLYFGFGFLSILIILLTSRWI
ncbi:hypothetical protein C0584_01130 [Candidatus Parcubacteria bacterium]|nr:MAG: hypothetical protein C0584_01130 [Candidatus Parcubacteria bacterium]